MNDSNTPDFEALRAAISCRMLVHGSFEYAMAESAINNLYWQEEELREIDSRILNLRSALDEQSSKGEARELAEADLASALLERASILDD